MALPVWTQIGWSLRKTIHWGKHRKITLTLGCWKNRGFLPWPEGLGLWDSGKCLPDLGDLRLCRDPSSQLYHAAWLGRRAISEGRNRPTEEQRSSDKSESGERFAVGEKKENALWRGRVWNLLWGTASNESTMVPKTCKQKRRRRETAATFWRVLRPSLKEDSEMHAQEGDLSGEQENGFGEVDFSIEPRQGV